MPSIRLLLTFAVVFSLVSLPSVLSSNFFLPNIPAVRAQQETTLGSWYPAGAQEQTLSISQGNGAIPTQVGWLETNAIDFMGSPLSASDATSLCPSNASIICTAPVADKGYFEIEFNLAGVFWGIPLQYGNSSAGVQLRQGIAHLVNKLSFAASTACGGAVCVANDDPLAPCSASSCPNGGLVNSNPCGWDTMFPESSSTNCIVGSPGGTAYNCAFSTACPSGTITGTTQFPWQPAIGSIDFCAAAQHFQQAFKTQFGISVTLNGSCELVPPKGGWPVSVTSLARSCSGSTATADVCFFVRNSEPRLDLGEGLAQEICALFSPAWTGGTGWTTLASQPFSCDNTNTGTGNAACGGGSCPFLQEITGLITSFCGFNTNPGTPDLCWGMATIGFGQVFPFDSTTYFEYNSLFATQTTVTCTNVDCSSNMPGSTCASTTPSLGASDFNYVCSPTYDSISTKMEYAPCLAATGDPVIGQATPSFANCPGTSQLTSVSAGYQAVDLFGKKVFTLPIWTGNDYYARLSNWPQGAATPGVSTAVGGGLSALPNYFNWLNAYSPTPAVAGTIRQGFLTTVDNLNPFDFTTLWDSYLLSNIYDGLFEPNPLCSIASEPGSVTCSSISQNIDWMTTSHSLLCYSGGPACTSTTLGYGNSTYFVGTTADLRLTLNRANHWHDGGPVTAWDVKYSFMNLNSTGAFQATSLSNVAHINVLDEFTLDLNLKAKGPFTELFIGGVTVIPGHIWSACGASSWNSGVTGKNIAGANVVNAAEDGCVGSFASPSLATVLVGGVPTPASSPIVDVVANNLLVGSGPYGCQSVGGAGHPTVGTIGGGCSVDNTMSPASNLNDFTLTRTGCTLTSTGTTCGVAGSSSDYFRSSGSLATYIWTGDIGSGSADFSKVLTVNSCHSSTPSANCPHWAQGIGNPGGTGSNAVGLSQRLKVNSLKGVSWIGFSTEKTPGSQLVLTCSAGYTIPGTTITPCTATNAGWSGSVMPFIGTYAGTLHEVGSLITIGTSTTSTSTLSPASSLGCAAPVGTGSAYPNGGYDC
jgi:hypothetical protein